jgi:acyl carrier protein
MTTEREKDFRDAISKILLLDGDKIRDDLPRKEVDDWDSLTHLMLVSELESTFGITLDDEDVMGVECLGDLKAALRKAGVEI